MNAEKNIVRTFGFAVMVLTLLSSFSGSAMAESKGTFTPSVEQKSAPTVLRAVTSTGKVWANIRYGADLNGQEGEDGWLVITPAVLRAEVQDLEVRDVFVRAYEAVAQADTLGMLRSVHHEDWLGVDLEERLALMGSTYTAERLVARDLFNIYAGGTYANDLLDEENYVDLTLEMGLAQDKELIVGLTRDGERWALIPSDWVTIDRNGDVTLRLYDLGVLAIVVPAED